MTKVITFGNFKGGVGKTTTTTLFSYILSEKKGKKILAIDTDPQANLTARLVTTFDKQLDLEKNIYNAIFSNKEIDYYIQNLSDNLDLLSGSWDMIDFEKMSNKTFNTKDLLFIFDSMLNEISKEYDYILIDTAPSTNDVMENVIMASDYVLITTQTLQDSFESTQKFYNFLLDRYESSLYNFELLGVLPYLVGKSASDNKILNQYQEIFGNELFENYIRTSDKIKSWANEGITTHKPYDQKALNMYIKVVDEAINKMI